MYNQVRGDKCALNVIYPILSGLGKIGMFKKVFPKISIMEGRYKSTNEAIAKLGDCSVLELAAGISPRGLEATDGSFEWFTPGSWYVETDLRGMVHRKRNIVGEIRAGQGREVTENHRFFAVDVADYIRVLKAGVFLQKLGNIKPIAVVHEGLWGYLDREKGSVEIQTRVRDNIAGFLRDYSNGGAWITPDFSMGRSTHADGNVSRFFRHRIRQTTKTAGSKFTSDEEVCDFLREGGLRAEVLPNKDIAKNLSCIKIAGLDPARVEDCARSYRAWYITLQ